MRLVVNKVSLAVILLISILAVGLIHLPVNANAANPKQPFSVDLFRGDVNQTSLASFFNEFTTSRVFVYPIGNALPVNYHHVRAGNFTLGITLIAQVPGIINQAKHMHVTYLVYDLEPGAGAEYKNYVNSTATVANMVHAAGLKIILEPRWLEIQSYGTQIAPYADMITMQLPYPLSTLSGGYVNWVSQYSTLLNSSAGHSILIGEQLLTKPNNSTIVVNNYNPADIAIGYDKTKQYINYFQLFYFNRTYADNTNTTITNDVHPYLAKFYKDIGIPGIS